MAETKLLCRGLRVIRRPFIVLTLLCLNQQFGTTSGHEPQSEVVTKGCNVTRTVAGSKQLFCRYADFQETPSIIRSLGKDLETIDIRYCTGEYPVKLNQYLFEKNSNLKSLYIWGCNVREIANGTFSQQRQLERLSLSYNHISIVRADMFRGLGNLKYLGFFVNQISTLSSAPFAELRNLTTLVLTNNVIETIESNSFFGLANLKRLRLGSNRIKLISREKFRGLNSLETLFMQYNAIRTIPNGTFQYLKNLKNLFLRGQNGAVQLSNGEFLGLEGLQTLDLAQTQGAGRQGLFLPRVEPWRVFKGMTKMKNLILDGINLEHLEESSYKTLLSDQIHSLRSLRLRRSGFNNSHLPIIKELVGMRKLILFDNQLGYILRTSLPKIAEKGVLDLSGNNILYIEKEAFQGMQKLYVLLDNNPFHCSCKLGEFARWLRSPDGSMVKHQNLVTCGGPMELYGMKVVNYDPFWWQCSPYVPLVALVFVVGFVLIIILIVLVVYCNRVNLRHWLLERRELSRMAAEESEQQPQAETDPRLHHGAYINSLRQGKTGAFVVYDMYDTPLLNWVNSHIEDQLYYHPMKITLQWSAGPDFTPLWKQIKDFSFQVNAFLVLVTDDFLKNHWPEIGEKSGVENITKCVVVLHGVKKSELPKEMRRLRCPCYQWPESGKGMRALAHKRDQFWKSVRLALNDIRE